MMNISKTAYVDLDIDYILNKIITGTPYGDERKKSLKAYGSDEIEDLKVEIDKLEEMIKIANKHKVSISEMRTHFKKIRDIRFTLTRIENGDTLSVTELFEIKMLVSIMKKINETQTKFTSKLPEDTAVYRLIEVEELLDPAGSGVNTFYIYDDYSDELRRIRNQIRSIEDSVLRAKKETRKRLEEELGIKIRSNGEASISKENKEKLKEIEESGKLVYSQETYMNVAFLVKYDDQLYIRDKEVEELKHLEEIEEVLVRKEISKKLGFLVQAISENINAIGNLDILIAKAAFSIAFNCIKPEIVSENVISIIEGRNIKVESNIKTGNKKYTPVSATVKKGVACITGANMGGKTVTLKMLGMLTALAQYGLYVPATSMKFYPRDFIFTSIGDAQNLDMGLSTFGAEIVNIKDAIRKSENNGLVLIDELARGTNPREGYAISKAIIKRLKKANSISIITTHFDGLADDEDVLHLQVSGLSKVDFDKLILDIENTQEGGMELLNELMDYSLKEIHSPEEVPKDAINISRLMGLDEDVLNDARSILDNY